MRDHSEHSSESDGEQRGVSWVLMMALVVLTLAIAVVLGYLVLVHSFPRTH